MKEETKTMTGAAVVFLFVLSGVFWFVLLGYFLRQETYHLHWECNGTEFDLEVIAKDANLICL